MNVPLRKDSASGLTIAQFKAMPERLRKRAAANPESADAQALVADIPVWEQAAKQLEGETGRWSIEWTKVNRGMRESEVEVNPDEVIAEANALLDIAITEIGARNSKADMGVIQQAHDAMVQLGATCAAATKESFIEFVEPTAQGIGFNESGWGDADYVTFAEADAVFDDEKREVIITPIRPGFGNKRDGFYYPAKTIREAVEAGRFNNVKMYANHPTKTQEKELPERSVNDWVGVVKETTWDETHQRPRSRLKVLDESVYRKFKEAPEHIAYSVLGGGRARRGTADGRDARIVESMDKVRSIDWVTEAGAGGGITFAESADEEFDMDIKNLTIEQVREGNPELFAAIREEADEAEAKPEATSKPEEAKAATPEKAVEDEKPSGSGTTSAKAGKDAAPAPEGFVPKEQFDALKAEFDGVKATLETAKTKEAEAEARSVASEVIADRLKGSLLNNRARAYVVGRFAEAAVGEGFTFAEADDLVTAVDAEIAAIKALTGDRPSNVSGLGVSGEDAEEKTLVQTKESDIEKRLLAGDTLPEGRDASKVSESNADRVESIASRI